MHLDLGHIRPLPLLLVYQDDDRVEEEEDGSDEHEIEGVSDSRLALGVPAPVDDVVPHEDVDAELEEVLDQPGDHRHYGEGQSSNVDANETYRKRKKEKKNVKK